MLKVIRFLCSKYLTGYGVPEQPHFDPLSTPAFEELLGRARCYLEFGSGGSTLAAARRGVDTRPECHALPAKGLTPSLKTCCKH